jgi:hypothetical protein
MPDVLALNVCIAIAAPFFGYFCVHISFICPNLFYCGTFLTKRGR